MSRTLQQIPIAIIGLAGIFPEAKNLREYWDNIVRKKDCITDVPPSRWPVDDYYDPDPSVPDKTYAQRGGFLPDIDFDPLEFGLPPNILEVTEVSQLLGLLVAKAALKDAGYEPADDTTRERTGVILGVGGGQKLITPLTSRLQYPILEKVLQSYGIAEQDRQAIIERYKLGFVGWDEAAFPGLLGNVVSGRIANRLDLGGINCVVDAACASSLSALKMAMSELLEQRCDMMITGGVDTDNSIFMYMCFSKTPALSRLQITRPFDADSDGMMLGEGIGMLVLKRLADAERDGDRIYAVIRGIGTSSDGRFRSIYAPRASGQALALRRAYEDAGYAPTSVSLIEAHGTGTIAGDPTEVEALKTVFGEDNGRKQHIALGSIKSQIGHTKATAGAASLIKAALALHHNILPPTINVTQPNPRLEIEDSPFYVNTEARPWLRTESDPPRRAGVSSFGFGGTNFHVTLEEYRAEPDKAYRLHTVAQPIVLKADTPAQLLTRCREIVQQLQSPAEARHFTELVETSKSSKIPSTSARLGFVAESSTEAGNLLQTAIDTLERNGETDAWEHPQRIFYRRIGVDPAGKVVALFPGQGSQYPEMGRALTLNFASLRQVYQDIDRLFRAYNLGSLSEIVFPKPVFTPSEREAQAQCLQRTEYAQPAVGVFSLGLYRLLQQAGFAPDLVAGHSFGELTALWAAGVMRDEDFLYLAKARGQALAAPDEANFEAGAMLAVNGDAQQLQQTIRDLAEVTIANFNSARQTVLAGATSSIKQAQERLQGQGFSTVWLPVSAAFHTRLVKHAQRPFARALDAVTFNPPRTPVYANASGQPYPDDPAEIKEMLIQQILSPVLFQQQIENLYAAGGRVFVEIGPKSVLTNLVKEILSDRAHLAVAINPKSKKDSDRQLREAVVQLRVAGLTLHDVDPHQPIAEIDRDSAKSKLNIRLNGSNYISEKTKMTFKNALQQGHQIETRSAQTIPGPPSPPEPPNRDATESVTSTPVLSPQVYPASAIPAEPQTRPSQTPASAPEAPQAGRTLKSLEQNLNQFYALQSEVLRVHQQYLDNQNSYAQIFFQLTQQQLELMTGVTTPEQLQLASTVSENLMQNMLRFHDQQSGTLRVHEQYLKLQANWFDSLVQLVQGHTLPNSEPAVINAQLEPQPPAPPIGAPVASVPVPATSAGIASPTPASNGPLDPPQGDDPRQVPPLGGLGGPSDSVNIEQVSSTLLEVVSDKTGYPTEMLETDMDMEADLGIDSIKRVEILGAMQDRFPDLPHLKPEELAELRTLEQVINHIKTTLQAITQGVADQVTPVQDLPDQGTVIGPSSSADTRASSDIEETLQALLEVVSDKTGYPAEMLEPDMDMEADLGIDSIKRVEIFGAMQDHYPNLPHLKPEELAELRTLDQVTAYIERQLSAKVLPQSPNPNGHQPPVAPFPVRHYPVRLKPLPAPDFLEFELPPGHICLITDDGGPTGPALVQHLSRRGWPVVLLSFPPNVVPRQAAIPPEMAQVILPDMSETHLQQRLVALSDRYGPVGAFIHLNPWWSAPALDTSGNSPFPNAEEAVLKHIFLMAKHLQPSLNAAAAQGHSFFLAIARLDGQFGLGQGVDFSAIGGGLFGLTKSLNLEWGSVFCRAIDLHPKLDTAQATQAIIAEMHDPNRLITEVGYSSQGRVTLNREEMVG